MKKLGLVVPCFVLFASFASRAHADEKEALDAADAAEETLATRPGYANFFFTSYFGDGLRFNNPFRLATPLGDDAESVSRTAPYVDIGIGATFGNPLGYQHGATLRTAVAVTGVGQVVMTPSYLGYRRFRSLAAHGRLGIPIVLTPDITWGFEVAAGATWYFLGGIGVSAELVGNVFYGAGTTDVKTATYPVLSGQLGFVVDYEVLP